ncbi:MULTISPECIES: hypothetical protein [unclassified Clostridioides]|uniref:hypothetical protein n=1 Tax=unclassified Clostridioides TaxID=2635829 RepID=UPI001D10A142|nr:hypothetical protein [Clostridioides sp. ZZV14-6045]MCC0731180.1 hypothetical protein [Clostridioides sp. ZZV14-6048]MCC0735391.1 hypothetical protein [Clostridioides sp. ZZV14-6009]MCC0740441.1 hypothetical protein [Clostridioides sp. ZZV14-5902]
MNQIYFAKSKNIGDFYVGTGNKIGFKSIGALKTSIILKDKEIEQYDLYYIDLNLNIHKFVDWEMIK